MSKSRRIDEKVLSSMVSRMVDNRRVFSAVMCVESSDRSISWYGAAGGMNGDDRYFIASVTKLYVTAVILRLVEENRLNLDDRISKYLPEYILGKLHVHKGIDYSKGITIAHLISNTSGLPDYFFHRQAGGRTVASELMDGNDKPWPLDKTIGLIKNLKPNFRPGAKGRASYSDSNYQLLGRIIETVTGKSIGKVFNDFIFNELNLTDTYVYSNTNDKSPTPFYYKSKKLWLPRYMTSIGVEGGIVSTAPEVMLFIREFFKGRFFPRERINGLKRWNLIIPPPSLFYFGIGLEKLWIPRFVSPFKPIGEIIGFWGQTGSFAFYNPNSDLFFTGTTNQINGAGHRSALNTMLKVIKSVL